MNYGLLAAFLAATFVMVVTPGPSVALASSQALQHGPKAALITVAGDALGTAIHIFVATLGLRVIVEMSSSILPWLQIAGGLYILYLAVETFRSDVSQSVGVTQNRGSRRAFVSGLLACVSNPKAIIFFMSLFPGFIDANHNVAFQSFVYGVLFITLDAIFICGYALLAVHMLRGSRFSAVRFEVLSGLGLGAIGCLLVGKGVIEALPAGL